MKKKGILQVIGGVVIILFVVLGLGGCFDSDESKSASVSEEETAKTEETTKEPEASTEQESSVKEEVAESSETSTDLSDYYVVGDAATDGYARTTILDIKLFGGEEGEDAIFTNDIICVLMDIENISDREYTVRASDCAFYIDDYQYSPEFFPLTDEIISDYEGTHDSILDINAGRKSKYLLHVMLPDQAYDADTVELDIRNGILILIKDNGEWVINKETNESASAIDTDSDMYTSDNISGEIDTRTGSFICDTTIKNIVPGEYRMVDGDVVATVTESGKISLKIIDGIDYGDYDMEGNYDDDISYILTAPGGSDYNQVVSFYEGGLYLYTLQIDDENDILEGFYELLN